MHTDVSLERKLLQFSTVAALFFALLGIGLGLWMGSLVIVFDGAYSFVSLSLTVISLLAASYIHSPKRKDSKQAAAIIEPSVIAFKGLVITMMCMVSFYSAVTAIMNGGRDVDAGLALMFGVVNVVGCLATFLVLKKYGKQSGSALVDAESKQWMMDTVISGAVMAGFIVASILVFIGQAQYAAFADPLMVVVASIYFVIVPVKMMAGAIKDLKVEMAYRQRT
ncbi:cation transporter [Photobacterium sanctipauli]|uniref:Cation transporter n=1 Tax=Photobacterium sanctipauli TaxID=1342794 RepID=A0A2T3NP38_9GAMM|nr:cation transporter [Photobacterium sanctipauli]